MATDADERSPLLGRVQQDHAPSAGKETSRRAHRWAPLLRYILNVDVERRILFAGFLITLSFSFTQVP
jgi:hypothetical protein